MFFLWTRCFIYNRRNDVMQSFLCSRMPCTTLLCKAVNAKQSLAKCTGTLLTQPKVVYNLVFAKRSFAKCQGLLLVDVCCMFTRVKIDLLRCPRKSVVEDKERPHIDFDKTLLNEEAVTRLPEIFLIPCVL